jgi:hypothetical protein
VNVTSLRRFSEGLRRLPLVVGAQVAEAAAPAITDLARRDFEASQSPEGTPWEPSVTGDKVTLNKSGNLAKTLRYVAIGTKLRVALGVPYAKYQIGRRPVFPSQSGALPEEYTQTLHRIAVRVVRQELGR